MASYKIRLKAWATTHRFSDLKPGDRVTVVGKTRNWNCPCCKIKHQQGIVANCNDIYPEVQVAFRGHPCWIKLGLNEIMRTPEYELQRSVKGLT